MTSTRPVIPVEMTVRYTLTVKPGAVAPGETVRCWIPYPKENHLRQNNIKLITTSQENFIIAPDSVVHRSVYMEAIAEKNKPIDFSVSLQLPVFRPVLPD